MDSFVGECLNVLKNGWRFLTNVRSLERDMNILRGKANELSAREEDVMIEVEREEVDHGKKRKREVHEWLQNVKRFKEGVDSIETKVREEKGWISRCKLSMHIADMKTDAVQLQEKSAFSNGVAVEPLLGIPIPLPTEKLRGESAKKTLRRIWNHLLDVEIRTVGVYGMAGVGKTATLKHIYNQLKDSGFFKRIFWVTVSKAHDLERLQREIASVLQLDLSNENDNEERISSKIHAALSRRERCLLVLDDVWKAFSLDRIGIPEPNQSNGFKLVVTTRSRKVCDGMGIQSIVKVEVLSANESWDLFKEKVGGCVLDSSEIKPIAELIVKECGGLPLAINTVGGALRGKGEVSVWRNAVNELKRSYEEIDGMDDYVFPRLRFSYDQLRNDRFRDCFLYCALYSEDYEISSEQLIDNWVGEGLIDEREGLMEGRDKGRTILWDLIDACMIEDDFIDYTLMIVKLHDLLRDLAIIITRESPRFMVKAKERLEESPRAEEWKEDMKRVSLVDNKIKILSGQPMCPELTTLFLQGNDCLWKISESFFINIRGLRVLDLSKTGLVSLPRSFFALTNLSVLRLDSCRELRKVPSLAKLKQLRVLSFDDTLMEELPQGLERLINLRKLSLNRTTRLKLFPAGIIPKLTRLEELQMINSGWRWPSQNTPRAAAHIEEIADSTQITSLQLTFRDIRGFNDLVCSGRLSSMFSFCITLGDGFPCEAVNFYRSVVVGYGLRMRGLASTLVLPSDIHALEIRKVHGITSLSQFSCLANETLTELMVLGLYSLPNLRALFDGVASFETFANLERLTVESCNQMKSLLPLGLLQFLQKLEQMSIQNCALMEDIVVDDENALTTASLPKLSYLNLQKLPKLKSIFKMSITCSSLDFLRVNECPELKKLPFTSHNLPPLWRFYGEKEWWDTLEWDDPATKIQLQDCFIEE